MMDETVKILFPCVCIILAYTIFFIFLLKSDLRRLRDDFEKFKVDYWKDVFGRK
jgi:hypothetical protein